MDELVHLDVERGIATVTLDSPANRNALSAQLRGELDERLRSAYDDDRVRAIVLTHTGSVFCAGMDLKEAGSGKVAGDEFPRILESIWTGPKPVVVRLAGPARAGGLGLVAAADVAIATDDVTFALTEVRIGVVPALISAVLLRRMPPRAANELFLTGETFDAARAVEVGLLTRAVPAAEVDDEVRRYTDMFALGAPNAMQATKDLLRRERPADVGADLASMLEISARFFGSDEGREGIAAFLEKRKPAWAPVD